MYLEIRAGTGQMRQHFIVAEILSHVLARLLSWQGLESGCVIQFGILGRRLKEVICHGRRKRVYSADQITKARDRVHAVFLKTEQRGGCTLRGASQWPATEAEEVVARSKPRICASTRFALRSARPVGQYDVLMCDHAHPDQNTVVAARGREVPDQETRKRHRGCCGSGYTNVEMEKQATGPRQERRSQVKNGDRGKIRTYNFPQNRVRIIEWLHACDTSSKRMEANRLARRSSGGANMKRKS